MTQTTKIQHEKIATPNLFKTAVVQSDPLIQLVNCEKLLKKVKWKTRKPILLSPSTATLSKTQTQTLTVTRQ